MVTYPVGTHLYAVFRPRKHGHHWNTGYWFRHRHDEENTNPAAGNFDWDQVKFTSFSEDEALETKWGVNPPMVDTIEEALEVTSPIAEITHHWCWLYVGTVWDLED